MFNNYRHRNRLAKLNRGTAPQQPPAKQLKRLHLFHDIRNRRAWLAWLKMRVAAYKAYLEATRDPRGRAMHKRVGPWRIMIEASDIARLRKLTIRAAQYRLERVREEMEKGKREPVTVDEYCEIFERDADYIRSVLNNWDEEKWARLKASAERGYSKPLKRKKKKKKKKPTPVKKKQPPVEEDIDLDDVDPDDDDDMLDDDEPLWHEHRL